MRAIGIYVAITAIIFVLRVHGTIDVNLSELEYLAARLDPFECRRLIAALHYTTYDLPKSLAAAGRPSISVVSNNIFLMIILKLASGSFINCLINSIAVFTRQTNNSAIPANKRA